MASRTVEWVPALVCGFVLLQVGCVSTPNTLELPADGILLPAPGASPSTTTAATTSAPSSQLTSDELDQLVAPIALYPDALVAQILAASTYPTEVVEAERWMQQHPEMSGETLAQSINGQLWDPSVKALAQFPTVLAMMDKNLSWTSAVGEAYVREPQSVMDAVQMMRQRAQQAGNLQSTPQENVAADGDTITIEPTDPEIVYVPEYDPWVIYGAPLSLYPGWVDVPGVFYGGPGVYFGIGIGIGIFGGFAWGWHHWDPDWHHHDVTFDHHPFVSHSPSFVTQGWRFDDHGRSDRGSAAFGHPDLGRPNGSHPEAGRAEVGHSFTPAAPGLHPGAFGGFDHGGVVRAYSGRGQASLGGGFHGGAMAGGFHGGGFHGGGSHR